MIKYKVLFLLVMLCSLSSFIRADVLYDDFYRLKIGDVLILGVYGELLTRREVTVGPTGSINYLLARSVPAEGRTIAELKKDLTEKLKSYYRDPTIVITASESIGEHYTIIGEVKKPGKKVLLGGASLLTALCESGGFNNRIWRDQTIDLVDFNHSFLTRNGHYIPIDFERLIKYGDITQDIPLQPGDFVFMASYIMPKVFILGEVQRPLTINYLDTISLAEALAEAGGVTRRASSRVYVIRGSLACPKGYSVDINRILKAYTCNFWLEQGDIVYVPPMKFSYLKEIVQGGISTFISLVATVAGTSVFLEVTPKAKGTAVAAPVPIIGTSFSGATSAVSASAAGVP